MEQETFNRFMYLMATVKASMKEVVALMGGHGSLEDTLTPAQLHEAGKLLAEIDALMDEA
jgi:hypothetical protein